MQTTEYFDDLLTEWEKNIDILDNGFKTYSDVIREIDFKLFDYASKHNNAIDVRQNDLIDEVNSIEGRQKKLNKTIDELNNTLSTKYGTTGFSSNDSDLITNAQKLNIAMCELEQNLANLVENIDGLEKNVLSTEISQMLRQVEIHQQQLTKAQMILNGD